MSRAIPATTQIGQRRGFSALLSGSMVAGSCSVVSVTGILTWLSVVTGLRPEPHSHAIHQFPVGQAIRNHRVGESGRPGLLGQDRKSTRLNSSHVRISYAGFCLKKKTPCELRWQVRMV